jgi:uncharacterized membrane protein YdcZ (DUF606 family)
MHAVANNALALTVDISNTWDIKERINTCPLHVVIHGLIKCVHILGNILYIIWLLGTKNALILTVDISNTWDIKEWINTCPLHVLIHGLIKCVHILGNILYIIWLLGTKNALALTVDISNTWDIKEWINTCPLHVFIHGLIKCVHILGNILYIKWLLGTLWLTHES